MEDLDLLWEYSADLFDGQTIQRLWGAASPDADVSPASLRAFLHTHLPAALVPDVIVRVGALPITASGAIDYDTLRRTCDHR